MRERGTRGEAWKAVVTVGRIGGGDPVSRWGICSESGTIRYSWRLVLAPEWVRRATVAHEVAHRDHMDHGPDFHALVERLLEADPTPARLWLRRNGAGLHRIGRRWRSLPGGWLGLRPPFRRHFARRNRQHVRWGKG